MRTTLSYFTGSLLFSVVVLAATGWYGFQLGGPAMASSFLVTALVLAILETSVSFDNAVVNASVLQAMSSLWRKLFMTVGIAVAVFGMRILFPLLIVAVAGDTPLLEAFAIATREPLRYQQIMHDSHLMIMGFGATFLLMVVVEYFVKKEKDEHWLPAVEPLLARLGSVENAQSLIAILLIALVAAAIPAGQKVEFLSSCFWGYVVFMALHVFKQLFGGMDIQTAAAKNGLIGFVYLETLDASFSMDGVIAAFAITNNFWLIAAGLGIGAMFVRSMTILLVERNIIGQFKYLETSAFWAIAALVAIMFAAALHVELGEVLTGLISVAIIGLGIVTSLPGRKRRRD
ncbi:DUF475 domain-containing protein [Chromobacterium haemolyticum]|uniref:DUF475 domain-containing protein n=1 Tax=Chromobacterium fluminis TaxID=3044269 RepID=A0ABX0L8Z9_9NEIS|nr:DUF475 domain-containing protein [Chromobacterium haemolyticum]NHR05563.1 DUF475 domain-containing protein [Chromobacterium haemolyticum]OQS39268.1 hypothetical protein B0T39_13250 [Chromobacterium haemolyticum]